MAVVAVAAAAAVATRVRNVGKVSVVVTLKYPFLRIFPFFDLLNKCNSELIMRLPAEEMSARVSEIWSVLDGVR